MQWLSYICTCEIQKTSFETNKGICYVLDDGHTVRCIVSPYVLCFYEKNYSRSCCGCSAQNTTPATPCSTGFSSWFIVCVGLLLLYMCFLWNHRSSWVCYFGMWFSGTAGTLGQVALHLLYKEQMIWKLMCFFFTLCACVCLPALCKSETAL